MRTCVFAAVVFAGATGCQREERTLHQPPGAAVTIESQRMSTVQPGQTAPSADVANPDESNAYALAQGKQLYKWYNCNGCHAEGGGDKGPALMDDVWIYGAEPANVFASIVEGRPNGMPAFGRHIPQYQVWQLVAYVRSMSGLVSSDAATSRDDRMQAKPAENATETQSPKQLSAPTSGEPAK